MFNKEVFASNLITLRKKSGLSTRKLGEVLGISHSAITQFEKGNALPALDTLIDIANYFGVSTDYLLGLDDYKYKNEPNPEMYSAEKIIGKDKKTTSRADKQPGHNKINELIEDLDEESMVELRKYIAYLRIRQTLDSGDDETSAGLDTAENN